MMVKMYAVSTHPFLFGAGAGAESGAGGGRRGFSIQPSPVELDLQTAVGQFSPNQSVTAGCTIFG